MKKTIVCLIAGVLLFALAGCTNVNNTPTPSPSMAPIIGTPTPLPATIVTANPNATGLEPSGTDAPAAPTLSSQESAALAKQCDTQIMKLSEVEQSVSVLVGNRVLSGITFAPQYKGALTERIQDLVQERVTAAAQSLEAFVTADVDAIARISALKDKQQGGAAAADLEAEFNEIAQAIQ